MFPDGNFQGSALITGSNYARPRHGDRIQGIAVIGEQVQQRQLLDESDGTHRHGQGPRIGVSKEILFARPEVGAKILLDMTQEWLETVLVAGGAFAVAALAYAIWALPDVAAMRRDIERRIRKVIALIQQGDEGLRSLLDERP